MSGFVFQDTGIAASVFLGLFVVYLAIAVYVIFRQGFKTAYSFLAVFGLIRVGGQISGIGFASQGDTNYKWLIGYLILGAEGYFFLVLCCLYFLIKEQNVVFGDSPLTVAKYGLGGKFLFKKRSFKTWFHFILIGANGALVAGSAILGGVSIKDLATETGTINTSKILRTVGQCVFLALNLVASGLTVYNFVHKKLRTKVIYMLLFVVPFITTRGIFGILAIYISKMNYMLISNYFSGTNHRNLTIFEYVLGTSMEFITGFVLLNTFWFRTPKPEVSESESENKVDV